MTKEQKAKWEATYPPEQYVSKEYLFSTRELIQLTAYETQIQLGQVANNLFQTYLAQIVLPRIGVENAPDINLNYDLHEGKIITATPIKRVTPQPPVEQAAQEASAPTEEVEVEQPKSE